MNAMSSVAASPRTAVPHVPDVATLMAKLDAIDGVMANRDRSDGDISASVNAAYALYERIEALPNTGAYLAVRARAIGSAVDNTSDVADLNLGELSAHAESNAGELIRQVLACILDAAPKSEDTPMLNIEVAA